MQTKINPPWVYDYDLAELKRLYRMDLQVNRHRLEKASQNQAVKFEKWHNAHEEVSADLSDEISKLGRIRGKTDLMIRRVYPELKEAGILAKVNLNKNVRKQEKKISMIRRYLGCLKGAVESARQRKSMIQTLKDLYIGNYWDKVEPKPAQGRRKKKKKKKKRR